MSNATRELLEQHFDTAFAAPDGIKKLRELILTLAMQGKLVPQDPSDPPASQLLKEIAAEKKRLVKEGKIKASKPQPEITAEEMPYALPQGWEWVQLGSAISYMDAGWSPKCDTGPAALNEWGVLKTTSVQPLCFWPHENKALPLQLTPRPDAEVNEGDILITRAGPKNRVGISCVAKSVRPYLMLSDKIIRFKIFGNQIYADYCALCLNVGYGAEQIERMKSGMADSQVNISQDKIKQVVLPIPPMPEQHRIVAKIDQLMARCDELERLRAEREQKRRSVHSAALKQLLDAQAADSTADAWQFISQHFGDLYAVKENVAELRKAVLQLAVMGRLSDRSDSRGSVKDLLSKVKAERHRLKIQESPNPIQEPKPLGYEVPEGWEWQCLGDLLVSGPSNGFSPRAVEFETQVRSLTLSATTSGIFKGQHSKFISDDIPADSDLWLRDGDILVQRGNTLEYVGVPAIYRGEPGRYIYPDLMMKLRVSAELDTEYVYFAMSSEAGRDFLRARASGTSGTMPKINQKTLKSLPIPIPPIGEQRRIVARINRLMNLCSALDEQIDAATSKQTELLDALMVPV